MKEILQTMDDKLIKKIEHKVKKLECEALGWKAEREEFKIAMRKVAEILRVFDSVFLAK